ncbi:MAG: hypothetical protein OXG37_08675 [Actinomycetia bacterium]|nr:hypothetical protein [Actinomycetes bacterium]
MDWDKDSVADTAFAKIDLLSLPVLDQSEEALDLIEEREGKRPDLSRIDPEDPNVCDLINAGRSKGSFRSSRLPSSRWGSASNPEACWISPIRSL